MIACPIFLHVSQGFKLRPPCLCGIYPESPVSPKAFYLEKVDLKPLLFRSCDRWNFVEKTLKKVSVDSKDSEIVPKPVCPIREGSCHQQNWGESY